MEHPYAPLTLTRMFARSVNLWPEVNVQLTRDDQGAFTPTTYKELYQEASFLAGGLKTLGVTEGTPVGLVSDNRKEWLAFDLGVIGLRACDVPRGRDTMAQELVYILGIPRCPLAAAENAEQADKILSVKDKLPDLKTLVILDREFKPEDLKEKSSGVRVMTYEEVRTLGVQYLSSHPEFWAQALEAVQPEDLATIIFTSGTTGEPKGVPLTHKNFCHQLKEVPKVIDLKPGEVWLSVLPVWHVFERVAQYIALLTGTTLAYSKPIGKIMLHDFRTLKPQWMASVPRIWEAIKAGVFKSATEKGGLSAHLFRFFVAVGSAFVAFKSRFRGRYPHFKKVFRPWEMLWSLTLALVLWPLQLLGNLLVFSKIRKHLGGRFKACISGGGSLPPEVDLFFSAVGITILNGYGLTETAPVLGIRNYYHPRLFTLDPLPDTEIKIVDDSGNPCPPGKKGLILARGGQVMSGYYQNPEATRKVLSPDGWFNTGDLGMWTVEGSFVIRGRAKDTIVLLGGENVEPGPIEARLRESPYIAQAVVVGQDQKFLGALILPEVGAVEEYLKANNIAYIARSRITDLPEVEELINEEITARINGKNGFRPFERIVHFALIERPFEVGRELSAKQEVKRHVVLETYAREIQRLFATGGK